MNNQIIKPLVATALAAALIVPAGCGHGNSTLPALTVPAEYIANYIPVAPVLELPAVEMVTPLPNMPQKATVFRIEYPTVDAGYAIEMAKKFDVSGEVREGDDMFTVIDSETGNFVEVFKTGSIGYSLESTASSELLLDDNAQLPSMQEAGQIAIGFLEEKGLLPPVVKPFMETDVAGLSLHRVRVNFRYRIGDYRGEGPGYRYSVLVGEGGKVAAASVFYPRLETYAEVELRSPQEALDDVVKGKGSWMQLYGEKVVLDRVSLRYYLQPVIGKQEYVLPVYVFEGTGIEADGSPGGTAAALATAVQTP